MPMFNIDEIPFPPADERRAWADRVHDDALLRGINPVYEISRVSFGKGWHSAEDLVREAGHLLTEVADQAQKRGQISETQARKLLRDLEKFQQRLAKRFPEVMKHREPRVNPVVDDEPQ